MNRNDIHNPIMIEIFGDDDFLQLKVEYQWKGDGTRDSPIIIENMDLGTIKISFTNLYFKIMNNHFVGAQINGYEDVVGILFYQVTHGIIEGNDFRKFNKQETSSIAINIASSHSIDIKDNVFASHNIAIQSSYSSNITIQLNLIENNNIGIKLISAENHLIKNNQFNSNNLHGVEIESGIYNTIGGNTFKENRDFGIILYEDAILSEIVVNNFIALDIGSNSQASDSGNYNIFANNYWSNHNNTDLNQDGYADSRYLIHGSAQNADEFPTSSIITTPYEHSHDYEEIP